MLWIVCVGSLVGCGGTALDDGSDRSHLGGDAGGAPSAPAPTGGAGALPELVGGAAGMGGGAPAPETGPEPWVPPERRGPSGLGEECEAPSDCEIPEAPRDQIVCHAGLCGFLCDRREGTEMRLVPSLQQACVAYGRACAYGIVPSWRAICL